MALYNCTGNSILFSLINRRRHNWDTVSQSEMTFLLSCLIRLRIIRIIVIIRIIRNTLSFNNVLTVDDLIGTLCPNPLLTF